MRAVSVVGLVAAVLAGCLGPAAQAPAVPDGAGARERPTVVLETDRGNLTLVVFAAEMPRTSAAFIERVRSGFYDGRIWERVVDNFVIQSEDREGDPADTMPLETHPGVQFAAGVLGMARDLDEDSATHVFFVTEYPQPHLHRPEGTTVVVGTYAAFGQLLDGWDALRTIAASPTRPPPDQERPAEDLRILSARIVNVTVGPEFDEQYPRVVAGRATSPPYRVSLEHQRVIRAGEPLVRFTWFVESQIDRSTDTARHLTMRAVGPGGTAFDASLVPDPADGNVHHAAGVAFPQAGEWRVSVEPGALPGATAVEFRVRVGEART